MNLRYVLKNLQRKNKIQNKCWITVAIQKQISIKNNLLTKIIKLKYLALNIETQNKYNQYKKSLSIFLK